MVIKFDRFSLPTPGDPMWSFAGPPVILCYHFVIPPPSPLKGSHIFQWFLRCPMIWNLFYIWLLIHFIYIVKYRQIWYALYNKYRIIALPNVQWFVAVKSRDAGKLFPHSFCSVGILFQKGEMYLVLVLIINAFSKWLLLSCLDFVVQVK